MDEIIEVYKETIDETLDDIHRILEYDIGIDNFEIFAQFEKILETSCKNITEKWSLGKKYVRTLFAKQAFSNYPSNILKLSLSIDVIVNLLDDILDEEIEASPIVSKLDNGKNPLNILEDYKTRKAKRLGSIRFG